MYLTYVLIEPLQVKCNGSTLLLGEPCSSQSCVTDNSACLLIEKYGAYRCACSHKFVQTLTGECILGPTEITRTEKYNALFVIRGENNTVAYNQTNDWLLAFSQSLSIKVTEIYPGDNKIKYYSSVSYFTADVSLDFTVSSQYVLQLEASDGYEFNLKQVITINMYLSQVNVIHVMLAQGTVKGTLVTDLHKETIDYDANEYSINFVDPIVKPFFSVQNKQVICGRDLDLEEITNKETIAREVIFSIWSSSPPKQILEVHVLIFKKTINININENEIGVTIASYQIEKDMFDVDLSSLPSILSTRVSTRGDAIIAHNGIDFENLDEKIIKFMVEFKSKNNSLKTSISIEVQVNDLVDTKPTFKKDVYRFVVLEGSSTNSIVGVVATTDNSLYSLEGLYKADFLISESGIIRCKVSLTRVRFGDEFNLTVIANNAAGETEVVIYVFLSNDDEVLTNLNKTFNAVVLEQQPIGTFVTNVGTAGYTGYTLADPLARILFNLNPVVGNVTTNLELDRETPEQENTDFTIHARNIGLDQCTDVILGHLRVLVNDVNDHPPVFEKLFYRGSVKEGEPNRTLITGLIDKVVTDADLEENAYISYELIDFDAAYFDVERSDRTFTILTNTIIDRESLAENFLVMRLFALNSKSTWSVSAFVYINITIEDVNDNSPVFQSPVYSVTLMENYPSSLSLTVLATDNDIGANGDITYSLSGGRGTFDIHPEIGIIFLKDGQQLDRENRDTYVLTIQAKDKGSPPLVGSAIYTITVSDVNDNRPELISPVNIQSIEEKASCIEPIFKVEAIDKDLGMNAQIWFWVTNDSPFEINNDTGEVRCKRELDYETATSHNILLGACDRGVPQLCTNKTVVVNVLDVNDNPPIFSAASYFVNITRGEWYGGKLVLAVYVNDFDSGRNSEIYLSLSEHNDKFTISGNNVGILRIKLTTGKPADAIQYQFYIKATDGGSPSETNSALVTVNVANDDYSNVKFTDTEVQFSIVEEIVYNAEVIGPAVVVDNHPLADVTIRYSLAQESIFQIDPVTGEIRTGLNFMADREKTDTYELIVKAYGTSDGEGQGGDLVLVKISVEDVNDNSPAFILDETRLLAYIDEDISRGQRVMQVSATDPDFGNNGTITYEILPASLPFAIDRSSGWVIISSSDGIDREERAEYEVHVTATDGGGKLNTTTLRVFVLDVNDNEPVFVSQPYSMTVLENANSDPKISIGSVTVQDKDASSNAHLTFLPGLTKLPDGNGICPFYVIEDDSSTTGQLTGTIWVNSDLSYDENPVYECLLKAVDMVDCTDCEKRLTGSATLTISVLDYNDHAPVFHGGPYSANVSRYAPINSLVTNEVKATDADSSFHGNNVVSYSMPGNSPFSIHAATGEITVSQSLHAAQYESFSLHILAKDLPQDAETSHTATAMIVINIYTSERLPYFNRVYTLTVREEREPITTVLETVQAFLWINGKESLCQCAYDLKHHTAGQYFAIDQETGAIKQTRIIDREKVGNFIELSLRAVDTETGLYSYTINITVTIIDINDNKPVFNGPSLTISVHQGEAVGYVIHRFTATDRDTTNNPEYSVDAGSNQYVYLSQNGTLFVTKELTNQTELKMTLSVKDTVPLEPSRDSLVDTSKMAVTIRITSGTFNNHAPVFTKSSYLGEVNFKEKTGTLIMMSQEIQATDLDQRDTIMYYIQSGNVRDILSINRSSSVLALKFDMDKSIPQTFELIVIAVDHSRPPKTGTCTVKLTILEYGASTGNPGEQSTMFMILFIIMVALLSIVSVVAVIAVYKWRTSSARLSTYAKNVRDVTEEKESQYDPLNDEKKDKLDSRNYTEFKTDPFSEIRNAGYESFEDARSTPPDTAHDHRVHRPVLPLPE